MAEVAVPVLDGSLKMPTSQMPAGFITDTQVDTKITAALGGFSGGASIAQPPAVTEGTLTAVFEYKVTNTAAPRPAVASYVVVYWDVPGTVMPLNMGPNDKWIS